MKKVLVPVVGVTLALGLTACSPIPNWMDWAKTNRPCQPTSILSKASSMPVGALSMGDPRVLTISELGSSCGVMPEYMELIDERDVGIVFTATVPEASQKARISKDLKWIEVPVFIALVDGKGKVLDRRDYEFSMTINNEKTWSRQRVAYPLPPQVKLGDPAYRVVLGLNVPQSRVSNLFAEAEVKQQKKHPPKKKHHKKKRRHKVAAVEMGTPAAKVESQKAEAKPAENLPPEEGMPSSTFGMTKAG